MYTRLKQIRKTLHMQQGEFARQLEVLQQQLSKYERGENKPSADFFTKLVEKFKDGSLKKEELVESILAKREKRRI